MTLIESILEKQYTLANQIIQEGLQRIIERKLVEKKQKVALEEFGQLDEKSTRNVQKMGKVKLVRLRVRGNKIQKRVRISAMKGYSMRNGKLVRMSPEEKLKRKMGARKAKLKRRAHMASSLRKRKFSLRKRKALGI